MEKLNSFVTEARKFGIDPILIDIFLSDLYDDNKSEEENLKGFEEFIK